MSVIFNDVMNVKIQKIVLSSVYTKCVSWGACPHYKPLNKNNVEMQDNAYKLTATSCMPFCTSCLIIMSVCHVIVYRL